MNEVEASDFNSKDGHDDGGLESEATNTTRKHIAIPLNIPPIFQWFPTKPL
jgi:hypothetical protein